MQLPVRDGIFSDLSDGKLYTLWSNTQNTDPSDYPSSFIFDEIRSLNADLTLSNESIVLSQAIDMGQQNGQNGIFAGMGYLIVYSGNTNHYYAISLCSGNVTDLGFLADPELYGSENWADWGVAERWNGNFSVVYRNFSNSNIVRRYLPGFNTEDVGVFSDLSDMASITWSPLTKRWYFHNESTTPVFGGGEETVGYAGGDGVSGFNSGQVDYTSFSVIVPHIDLGADTNFCAGSEFIVEAASDYISYSWNGISSVNNLFTTSETGNVTIEVTDINSCVLRDTILC
jgi:hypothetical protein